ncbi:MAG TPA: hypothetical protein VGI70_13175, partial [Polyangiales bacterium]
MRICWLAGAWLLAAPALAQAPGKDAPAAANEAAAHDAPSDYPAIIERALSAFEAQRLEEARDLFERAHALQPSARTLRGLGMTAFAQNRYTIAKPELEAALIDLRKPLTQAQRDEVTEFLSWMRSNLGTLHLQLEPAYAIALVDSQAINAGTNLLELGEHQLEVRATGYEGREQKFEIAPDKTLSLNVRLSPSLEAPPVAPPLMAAVSTQSSAMPTDDAMPRDAGSESVFGRWWFWTA